MVWLIHGFTEQLSSPNIQTHYACFDFGGQNVPSSVLDLDSTFGLCVSELTAVLTPPIEPPPPPPVKPPPPFLLLFLPRRLLTTDPSQLREEDLPGDLQSLSWLTSVDVPRLQQMADSRGHSNGPSQGSLLEQQTGEVTGRGRCNIQKKRIISLIG